MSSTSIVVKCLTDSKVTSSPHGQITIGTLILQVCYDNHSTLILYQVCPSLQHEVRDGDGWGTCVGECISEMRVALQDCMVGLLFAFMPVLANNRTGGNVDHFDVVRLLFR